MSANYILNLVERRVLGVLLEKSMTQPEYYPMTVNAIVTGCNQKNNRDPLLDFDEDTVWSALTALRERGLISRILPPPGSRADRFKHNVEQTWSWQTPQRAIMTELLLRGAQTPGELRGRASRFSPFESVEAVMRVLDSLQNWDPPLAAPLPREPGQSAVRYDHCMYPQDEQRATPQVSTTVATTSAPRSATTEPVVATHVAAPSGDLASLREELENAHAEIADLNEQMRELRQRIEALERLVN